MKLKLITLLGLLSLAGCQSTNDGSPNLPNVTSYQPENNEVYMLRPPSDGRRFGLANLCSGTLISCGVSERVDLIEFGGKNFYLPDGIVKQDGNTSRVYARAIFENGQVATFHGSFESQLRRIITSATVPQDLRSRMEDFEVSPLVEGSDVTVNEFDLTTPWAPLKLSNGQNLSDEMLSKIRSFADGNPAIAEPLTYLSLEYDEIDMTTRITSKKRELETHFRPVISISNGEASFGVRAHYYSDSWLFIDQITLVSGSGKRWESFKQDFRRDHTGGNIWEYMAFPLLDDVEKVIDNILETGAGTVRFQGRQYHSDYQLTRDDLNAFKHVMQLKEVL